VLPREKPRVLGVEAVGHVGPFDEDGAIELPVGCRSPHHDARPIWVAAVDDTARGAGRCVVAIGHALDEVLLLDVAIHRKRVIAGEEGVILRRLPRDGRRCDRAGHDRIRYCVRCYRKAYECGAE
jgi:hypothetical protein